MPEVRIQIYVNINYELLERRRRRYIGTSGKLCWLSPPCKGSMESMEADFRMTGEFELETGFGRDLIIRRMIGELPTCRDNGTNKGKLGWKFLRAFFRATVVKMKSYLGFAK